MSVANFSATFLRLLLVEGLLRLLDEGEDVAEVEDAAGHPVRVERLEVVEPLAGGGEHDRPAGDRRHGQRRTAAGVAVELGEHDAGEVDAVLERLAPSSTASWPIIASMTNSTSSGSTALRMSAACFISSASTPRRPAVSTMTTSYCLSRANFRPSFATLHRVADAVAGLRREDAARRPARRRPAAG